MTVKVHLVILFNNLVGIYGGIMAALMFSLDIVRKHIYTQDALFSQENINEIINSYLAESGPVNLVFDKVLEDLIIDSLPERDQPLDINNLKQAELSTEEWVY
jgi:hypothetical protein